MNQEHAIEEISVAALLVRVQELRQQNFRLVQIGATRLADGFELTYSFDLESQLVNLRLHLASADCSLPSITPAYWCAFLYENEIHDLFGLQIDGIAVDFHGKLYQTSVKFPFGTTRAPASTTSASKNDPMKSLASAASA